MVEPSNDNLSIVEQCRLLSISRSGWYYDPKGENPFNLKLMRMIDEQFFINALLRQPPEGTVFTARRLLCRTSPRAATYAFDGLACDLSGAAHEPASPAASGLSVSLAQSGCNKGASGLVHGHHLYPYQAGVFVSGGDYGLV